MLIDLRHLCQKYRFVPRGIIHVGAHEAEELSVYENCGIDRVVWIEGNPVLAERLRDRLAGLPGQTVLNYLILDVDDEFVEFKITNNSESSSVLDMERHLIHHPRVHVVDTLSLPATRLDTVISNQGIEPDHYDFLNLDIQGVELQALRGLGDRLDGFRYLYTEVNTGEVYSGCSKIDEIDDYLMDYGFARVETELTDFEWGDAFYVRNVK